MLYRLLLSMFCLAATQATAKKTLDVYFIDVEGGQATLYVAPSGESLLVDTGWPGFNGRDAERYLGAVVQSRPDSAPARNNLGTALAMQGRFGAAADHFAQAIAIDPGYVDAHFNLGLAQQRLGKSDEAKKQFQRVVELDPAHRAARNQLEHISD